MSRYNGGYAKKLRGPKRKIQGPANARYSRMKGAWDFTPPGYNYMGPGNVVDTAPGQSFADEYAIEHDNAYGDFQAQYGQDPKFVYVQGADDVFEDKMKDAREDFPSEMAFQIFRMKRMAAQYGLIPSRHLNRRSPQQNWFQLGSSLTNMDEGTHYSICHGRLNATQARV